MSPKIFVPFDNHAVTIFYVFIFNTLSIITSCLDSILDIFKIDAICIDLFFNCGVIASAKYVVLVAFEIKIF